MPNLTRTSGARFTLLFISPTSIISVEVPIDETTHDRLSDMVVGAVSLEVSEGEEKGFVKMRASKILLEMSERVG